VQFLIDTNLPGAPGLNAIPGITIDHPVEADELFVRLPTIAAMKALESDGAKSYEWEPPTNGRPLIRLVCSFSTADAEVETFSPSGGSPLDRSGAGPGFLEDLRRAPGSVALVVGSDDEIFFADRAIVETRQTRPRHHRDARPQPHGYDRKAGRR
jgi:hypothetical protein